MYRGILACMLMVGMALPATAETKSAELRQTVESMLGGFERPASDDEWAALGADAVPHLLDIAQDAGQPRSTRTRAVSALGNFSTPEVVTYLEEVLAPKGDAAMKRQALRALARTGGVKKIDAIGGYLQSEDSTLREAAVHALGLMNAQEATALMETHQASETSSAVLKAIEEELTR
jgi:HEAT repeat protein